ncbi:MAG: hypothetical protein KQI35_02425 [Bacteroidetes bacterium]|nr:hypothetical protein [Bacteroidota bacterium]
MLLKTLIGLGAALGLYLTIRTKKIFQAIITLGMIVGIILVLLPFRSIQEPGLYIYLGFVALAFIYGLVAKEKERGTRITICLMSAFLFTYWLWVINHWHGDALLAPILALIVMLASIIGKVKLKSEWGYLTILTFDAMAILLENWLKAN